MPHPRSPRGTAQRLRKHWSITPMYMIVLRSLHLRGSNSHSKKRESTSSIVSKQAAIIRDTGEKKEKRKKKPSSILLPSIRAQEHPCFSFFHQGRSEDIPPPFFPPEIWVSSSDGSVTVFSFTGLWRYVAFLEQASSERRDAYHFSRPPLPSLPPCVCFP